MQYERRQKFSQMRVKNTKELVRHLYEGVMESFRRFLVNQMWAKVDFRD